MKNYVKNKKDVDLSESKVHSTCEFCILFYVRNDTLSPVGCFLSIYFIILKIFSVLVNLLKFGLLH